MIGDAPAADSRARKCREKANVGHCSFVTSLTFARMTTKVWNRHEAARICDHEASSHRKDTERISNVAAEPMAGEIESRSGTNDAYRTVRTVCIAEDECRKMHGSQWHA